MRDPWEAEEELRHAVAPASTRAVRTPRRVTPAGTNHTVLGAWADEPWEGDVVAKVGPKIFAFFGGPEPGASLGLKCGDREAADVWLERYPGAARKSPYIGQHGWNTFDLDGTIPDDELADLVDASYAAVVAKLPRRQRPGSAEGRGEVDPI